MTYDETIDYLFNQLPVFQNVGSSAYKPGLDRVECLLSLCDEPHRRLKTVHIAGTNGKGSSSSLIASVLQASGLRVGLFTSPHLVDFRERIRINGEMIPEAYVTSFVERMLPLIPSDLCPSFFELTTAMAFAYFAETKVDIAVIEVGMGGRLDSTNVLQPLISLITNVSLDHTAYLGNTLAQIATEKAGIIKPYTPVVLGRSRESDVLDVVTGRAYAVSAPLILADRSSEVLMYTELPDLGGYRLTTEHYGTLTLPLYGVYQLENARAVLEVVGQLQAMGYAITPEDVASGFRQVAAVGLRGRLEIITEKAPTTIVDTGHNPGAWIYLGKQLQEWQTAGGLICLLGMAADKDVDVVLSNVPQDATLFITKAKGQRSMPADELALHAERRGIRHLFVEPDVYTAYNRALSYAREHRVRTLFIGGSNFLVGELLSVLH